MTPMISANLMNKNLLLNSFGSQIEPSARFMMTSKAVGIFPDINLRHFSAKTRKIEAKKLANRRVKKYKLKTKKSLQKRMRVVSKLFGSFILIFQ